MHKINVTLKIYILNIYIKTLKNGLAFNFKSHIVFSCMNTKLLLPMKYE